MSYRPYQLIERRRSRQIHVGSGRRRRRCAGHRADHDQHADHRRGGHRGADPPLRGGGGGHRPGVLPRPGEHGGAARHRAPGERADHRRHPFPLQPRHRGGRGRRRLPAHQPGQHRQRLSGCARWCRPLATTAVPCASASTPASWRSTCWRSTANPTPRRWSKARSSTRRFLQDHDFHEFKISVKASDVFLAVAAYQQLAEVCDYPLHIGITEAGGRRTGTVKSRRSGWAACCGPASATPSASRSRPSRRRRCMSAGRS